ncbi:MAG: plastocyanin/azurin family copper-binding protein [Balneolaceae bacterium]
MKTTFLYSIFVASLLLFSACGGGETNEQDTGAASADEGRTISIIGTDQMKFTVTEAEEGIVTGEQSGDYIIIESIEASAGEELSVRLTTESNMPPTAMSHNFVLLEQDANVDEFIRTAITARDNDYISPDYEDQVIAHTEVLGDGESDTITFTVPDEPGEYVFVCSFPGHFQGGMVGTLIVS